MKSLIEKQIDALEAFHKIAYPPKAKEFREKYCYKLSLIDEMLERINSWLQY